MTLEGRAASMDGEGGEETEATTTGEIKRARKPLIMDTSFSDEHRPRSCGSTG